ncbi:MAG: hypothetical protein AAFV43_09040 [Planctomycetota bacterium]
MDARRTLVALASLALVGVAGASEVRFWQDPVVTYTNGMRLPSTTSQRSHNVYWQCDPGHRGYCDGRMYDPCRNEVRTAGDRVGVGYRLPYGTTNPSVPVERPMTGVHSHDGLEVAQAERLGEIPLDADNAPRLGLGPGGASAPTAVAAPAAPAGSMWLDTLQNLGEQVMQQGETAAALGF